MPFNSFVFACFLLLYLLIHYSLGKRGQLIGVLFGSLVFYMWSQPLLVLVPLAMAAITYFAARFIESSSEAKRQRIFTIATALLIAIVVFYKYCFFFLSSVNETLRWLGFASYGHVPGFFASLLVPMGISYILFQSIGYLVEVKRGDREAEHNGMAMCAYLLFFPKIVSGPVERAGHFLPQLKREVSFDYDSVTAGIRQFAWGLFKKIVIAERLAVFVNYVYSDIHSANGIALCIAFLVFPVQLYADFSGYTDMALGIARMMGYELSPNFNHPFSSKSMAELWRRWHISLSSWFNDYFYMPLVIRTRDWGKWSPVFASMLTFLLLGLWHGASWTFVWSGGINGLFIAIEFLTARGRKKLRKRLPDTVNTIGGRAYVFLAFALALVFFRAATTADGAYVVSHLGKAGFNWPALKLTLQHVGLTAMDYLVCFLAVPLMFFVERRNWVTTVSASPRWVRWGLYYLFLVVIVVFGIVSGAGFIYQRF